MMVMFQTGEGDSNRDITTVMHTTNMSEITHCIIITESKCYSINFTKQTVTLYILLSSPPRAIIFYTNTHKYPHEQESIGIDPVPGG